MAVCNPCYGKGQRSAVALPLARNFRISAWRERLEIANANLLTNSSAAAVALRKSKAIWHSERARPVQRLRLRYSAAAICVFSW